MYINLSHFLYSKIVEEAKKENISTENFVLNIIKNKLQISDETIKQEMSKHKEEITKSLQELKEFYEICDEEDAFDYLVDYPNCIPALIEAEKHIKEIFPTETKSSIEIEHDPECADCDNLWVNLKNDNYDYDTMLTFQIKFDAWYRNNPWFNKLDVIFSVH